MTRMDSIPVGAVHPMFSTVMEHSLEEGSLYFVAAIKDPAPLTDLRVRLDLSTASMLLLNLSAISEVDSTLIPDLRSLRSEPHDHVIKAVFEHLRIESASEGSKSYVQDISAQFKLAPVEVYAALHSYVNVFGGWDDAEDIAREVLRLISSDPGSTTLDYRVVGTAALILALRGSVGYDSLFEMLLDHYDNPIELFFYGLRWASIEAKRNGNLDVASKIISRVESKVVSSLTSTNKLSDLKLVQGMSANFRGLLSLRSRDVISAENYSAQAERDLSDSLEYLIVPMPEERARYAWMAQLNRAQLAWLQNERPLALSRFEKALEFARAYDSRAIHTSLSTIAYAYLQCGDPKKALPFAEESADLVREEYDPRLVVQVQKVLLRCYLELGLDAKTNRLRSSGPYYWRNESWVQSD